MGYGEFEEVKTDDKGKGSESELVVEDPQGLPIRVRLPRKGEIIGVVAQRLGGNRMEVRCTDTKIRNCRVPGRFKRSMWLRPKDVVLVQPWPDDDSKADIIFHYNSGAANQLRKKGLLDSIDMQF